MDLIKYLVTTDDGGRVDQKLLQRRARFNPLEPNVRPGLECTAAIGSGYGTFSWESVPCNIAFYQSSYVCEIHNSVRGTYTPTQRITVGAYVECPPKTIKLEYGACITINTLSSTKVDNMSDICTAIGGYPHYVSRSIVSKDPLLWNEYETFYADILKAMIHRWPGISDYATIVKDHIVIVTDNDTRSVAFQFSQTILSNVEITDLGTTDPRGAAHVACEFPLLPINSSCLTGHFACLDGTCILEHYVCDGMSDCPDASDEVDCEHVCKFFNKDPGMQDCFKTCFTSNCTCNDLYFHCPLGGCVPWSRVCDGVGDCPRNEDEHMCKFYYLEKPDLVIVTQNAGKMHFKDMNILPEETFQCLDNRTISATMENDLIPDCWDQSDETEYYNFVVDGSKTTYSTQNSLCSGTYDTTCVKNYPDVCYPRHLFCILESSGQTTRTCRNAAHLSNCRHHVCPSQFKCPNAYCIPVHDVCDGHPDCPNGEDEADCHSISCPGFLLCRHDKICVHRYDILEEGHEKCAESQDDNALRDINECPSGCICYGYAMRCENRKVRSLSELPVSLRILILHHTIDIGLNDIKFKKGNFIFMLHLQVTNAGLDHLEPSHTFGLTFLIHLNVSFNAITTLKPRTFATLTNLLSMDLSHNLLEKLESDTFLGARMVNSINLNHNNLQIIPHCTFQHLPQLRILKISHNKITHLGKNLLCSPILRDLDISNNPLSEIDRVSLLISYRSLKSLNTTPVATCCQIPSDIHCLPMVKLSSVSSCQRLIKSSVIRKVLWLAGSTLLPVLTGAIVWCFWQVRVTSGPGLYNVLSLLMFTSNLYICVFFLTLSSIDHASQGHYSMYEGTWRHSIECSLLNSLSYSLFHGSMILFLLITCTRTIATLRPFSAQYISRGGTYGSAITYFSISMTLGYVSAEVSGYVNLPEFAFGLGFLLPGAADEHKTLLWKLIFFVPNTLLLFSLCCSQLILLKGLMVVPVTMVNVSGIMSNRNRAKRLSIANFVLILIQYCPLLLMHVLVMLWVAVPTTALFSITMLTLFFIPTTNVVLQVCLSGNFRRFISSKLFNIRAP